MATQEWHRAGFMHKVAGNKLFTRSDTFLYKQHENESFTRTFSVAPGTSKITKTDLYIPVNYIQPQVRAMFKSWEFMEKSCPPSKETFKYDPLRVVSDFSHPPKRFYRTFWQSAARKILKKCNR